MKYKLLDGVVYTCVCNQNLLVATRSVWGKCPYTKRLSALRGAFWQGLSVGMSEEEIMEELSARTGIKKESLEKQFAKFIIAMTDDGYLIPEEIST